MTLIFSAVAFVVLGWTENAFAEEAIALGLICAIVDGFGFQYFTIGVLLNFSGEAKPMVILVKLVLSFCLSSKAITKIYVGKKDAVDLVERDAKTETTEFVEQHVE